MSPFCLLNVTIHTGMTNKPRYIASLISRYLKDDLSNDEYHALLEWLAEDPANKQLFQRFTDSEHYQKDIDFLMRLDLEAAWQKTKRRRIKTKPKVSSRTNWMKVVAAVLLIFVGAWFVWQNPWGSLQDNDVIVSEERAHDIDPANGGANLVRSDGSIIEIESEELIIDQRGFHLASGEKERTIEFSKSDQSVQTMNTLEVPKAKYLKILLADGTKVWINSMSKLHFPSDFSVVERKVVLEGEAFFEVAEDRERPFIVESKETEIKVLGTEFNVNSYGKDVETALKQGSVLVERGGQSLILKPGEHAKANEKGIKKSTIDLDYVLAWKNDEFLFRNDNIITIASQISRWYGVEVKFQGEVMYDRLYTGSVSRRAKLSETMDMLEFVSDLSFKLDGNKLIIKKEKKI